jgi:lipoyl(octanoyl) transferase
MILRIRHLKRTSYEDSYAAMRQFPDARGDVTPDEVWLTEHPPVFTQGLAGKTEHILTSSHIPIIQSDRGGQVTYHGPGQLLFYVLIDLKRHAKSIRDLVCALEKSTIKLLSEYHIPAHAKTNAPGVYVADAKIASIGLRVRKGYTYHGLSLNIDMDLQPFEWINPCGFAQLKMTQISQFIDSNNLVSIPDISKRLIQHFASEMQYDRVLGEFGCQP